MATNRAAAERDPAVVTSAAAASSRRRATHALATHTLAWTDHASARVHALTELTRGARSAGLAGTRSINAAPVGAAGQASVAAIAAAGGHAQSLFAYAIAGAGHAGTRIDALTEHTLTTVRTEHARAGFGTSAVVAHGSDRTADGSASWVDAAAACVAGQAEWTRERAARAARDASAVKADRSVATGTEPGAVVDQAVAIIVDVVADFRACLLHRMAGGGLPLRRATGATERARAKLAGIAREISTRASQTRDIEDLIVEVTVRASGASGNLLPVSGRHRQILERHVEAARIDRGLIDQG